MMRILSGVQPSGKLHIGNYFGMMKPCIELQNSGEAFIFIADYHALTSLPKPNELRQRVLDVAIDLLACGLDPEKATLFRQTDIPEVTELTWILSCFTPKGLMERCHSYKDKVAKGLEANLGLFTYPVLMASDILIYRSNIVPVGKDQKQHLEVTRDIATRFNNAYGDILVMPEPQIKEEVSVVPGIDGEKMSKSYDNTIPLFVSEKKLLKLVRKIKTNSLEPGEPKDPDSCTLFQIHSAFASAEESQAMRQRYAEGIGWGEAKDSLFEYLNAHLREPRERYLALMEDPGYIEDVLKKGAERARAEAAPLMDRLRQSVGLGRFA